jgi:hypothetical protein
VGAGVKSYEMERRQREFLERRVEARWGFLREHDPDVRACVVRLRECELELAAHRGRLATERDRVVEDVMFRPIEYALSSVRDYESRERTR